MAGYDPNQPRDELGKWSTTRAARVGAGLAYEVKGGWARKGQTGTVHTFPGKAALPEDFKQAIQSQQEDRGAVRVIYNAETNTWHIAEQEWIDHGDFEKYALQGIDRKYVDTKLSRGHYNPETNEITMYDLTENWATADWGTPREIERAAKMWEKSTDKMIRNWLKDIEENWEHLEGW